MTKKDVAKNCLEILKTDCSNCGVEKVSQYLNDLQYSKNRKPISKSDKLAIVEEMIDLLSGSGVILEHSDNSSILQLIQAVKAKLQED